MLADQASVGFYNRVDNLQERQRQLAMQNAEAQAAGLMVPFQDVTGFNTPQISWGAPRPIEELTGGQAGVPAGIAPRIPGDQHPPAGPLRHQVVQVDATPTSSTWVRPDTRPGVVWGPSNADMMDETTPPDFYTPARQKTTEEAKRDRMRSVPIPMSKPPMVGITGSLAPDTSPQDAITWGAQQLGVTPQELAALISYETGGTMNPGIRGGSGNRHIGLIQFGPEEQRRYGVTQQSSFAEQIAAAVQFAQDRGYRPGMGIGELYSTVNAGSPGRLGASDVAAGGDARNPTVVDKVTAFLTEHADNAQKFLGGAALGAQPGGQPIDKMPDCAKDLPTPQQLSMEHQNVQMMRQAVRDEAQTTANLARTRLARAEQLIETARRVGDTRRLRELMDQRDQEMQTLAGVRTKLLEQDAEASAIEQRLAVDGALVQLQFGNVNPVEQVFTQLTGVPVRMELRSDGKIAMYYNRGGKPMRLVMDQDKLASSLKQAGFGSERRAAVDAAAGRAGQAFETQQEILKEIAKGRVKAAGDVAVERVKQQLQRQELTAETDAEGNTILMPKFGGGAGYRYQPPMDLGNGTFSQGQLVPFYPGAGLNVGGG